MRMQMWPHLGWLFKRGLRFLRRLWQVSLFACAGILGLAFVGFGELHRPVTSMMSTIIKDAVGAALGSGVLEFCDIGRHTATIKSHTTPIGSAARVGDGRAILTTAEDGSAKLINVSSVELLQTAESSRLIAAVRKVLWTPYGAPAARWSAWVVAQFFPVEIPISRRGRRGRVFRDCPECPELVEIEQTS